MAEATRRGKLRPNSVDSITGANSGDNLGPGTPILHFEQWERDEIEIKLILKGGGCENMNAQYSLPGAAEPRARRSHARGRAEVHSPRGLAGAGQGLRARGRGRVHRRRSHLGYLQAKEQLFRTIDDLNSDPRLAGARSRDHGHGEPARRRDDGLRRTGVAHRVQDWRAQPAAGQLFVSVAYDCWAYRRLGVVLDARTGAITRWLYRDPVNPVIPMIDRAGFTRTGLEVGNRHAARGKDNPVAQGGRCRARVRDACSPVATPCTHHLMKHDPPVDLRGAALYHCGPVMPKKDGDGWRVTAAGPTTSIREEPYQADVIRRYGVRAVIGKGGMGAKTLAALQESGAVY